MSRETCGDWLVILERVILDRREGIYAFLQACREKRVAFVQNVCIRFIGKSCDTTELCRRPRNFFFEVWQQLVTDTVACELYVGIAFVFAPCEVVFVRVGEEFAAGDIQERTVEIDERRETKDERGWGMGSVALLPLRL